MRSIIAVVLISIQCSFSASAEENPETEVVVTARRSEQLLKDTIQHTTVITEEENRKSHAIDVPSLLKREAGFEFVQSGGVGKQSNVLLRGTNSNQTLVLLDGVRINSATTGATALDQIMLDQVERIEIVRGNVSSIYGSEAVGGVIQIFLKQHQGTPLVNANVSVGEEGTQRYALSYGGTAHDTQFNVAVADFKTAGFSALRPNASPTADPDRDGYHNLNVSGNFLRRINPSHKIGAYFFVTNGDLDFDNAFAASINDKQVADTDISAASVFWQGDINSFWTSKVNLSQGLDKIDSFLNGSLISRFKTTNTFTTWQNNFQLDRQNQLSVGLEELRQAVTSTTAFTRNLRRISGLWVGYSGHFDQHHVQANIREERYSDFGDASTHFLGYGYDITGKWRINLSKSTAFRAPTFNDLFFPFGFGNPNLQPERARSNEINLQYAQGDHLARLALFRTRITDLIGGFPITNINRAQIDGIELSYSGKLLGADVKISYTTQDPVDKITDLQLIRRAKKFATVVVDKAWDKWNLGFEVRASSRRFDNHITAFPTQRVELAGYGLVNAIARYNINKHLSLAVRAENIFDKDYTLAHGFNTQGRVVWMNLALNN